VGSVRGRDAVRFLVRRPPGSERRACRVIGQHRSTQRYARLAPEYELCLAKRMNEFAAHPRLTFFHGWEGGRGAFDCEPLQRAFPSS
jgi:hypothetical protein